MAAFGWDSEWEGETGWQRGEIIKGDTSGVGLGRVPRSRILF